MKRGRLVWAHRFVKICAPRSAYTMYASLGARFCLALHPKRRRPRLGEILRRKAMLEWSKEVGSLCYFFEG
ncbi:MAG: hypothetical protein RL141_1020 [Candidatus Parcubacteria bacterium]|jgi:hypothetical protein